MFESREDFEVEFKKLEALHKVLYPPTVEFEDKDYFNNVRTLNRPYRRLLIGLLYGEDPLDGKGKIILKGSQLENFKPAVKHLLNVLMDRSVFRELCRKKWEEENIYEGHVEKNKLPLTQKDGYTHMSKGIRINAKDLLHADPDLISEYPPGTP